MSDDVSRRDWAIHWRTTLGVKSAGEGGDGSGTVDGGSGRSSSSESEVAQGSDSEDLESESEPDGSETRSGTSESESEAGGATGVPVARRDRGPGALRLSDRWRGDYLGSCRCRRATRVKLLEEVTEAAGLFFRVRDLDEVRHAIWSCSWRGAGGGQMSRFGNGHCTGAGCARGAKCQFVMFICIIVKQESLRYHLLNCYYFVKLMQGAPKLAQPARLWYMCDPG